MNIELLIHAVVRQTTILIAQLATSGGVRAPLAQIANQVFLDLVRELERQGVSRKVSADMFGLGLRTYRRKIQRLSESSTERGRSLWEVVLEYVRESGPVTRREVLTRFPSDDEAQARAVLHDLSESGLVISSGVGSRTSYRAASAEELAALGGADDSEGKDDLLLALMYREGPLSLGQIAALAQVEPEQIEAAVTRLANEGRIERVDHQDGARYHANALVIPLGSAVGWEAAVFDHFKAMVTTVLCRLREHRTPMPADQIGGSTYTIDVWDGHPLEGEVRGTLAQMRSSLSELRARVADFNADRELPDPHTRAVIYVGQSLIQEANEDD